MMVNNNMRKYVDPAVMAASVNVPMTEEPLIGTIGLTNNQINTARERRAANLLGDDNTVTGATQGEGKFCCLFQPQNVQFN